jgi:hypothetical protein
MDVAPTPARQRLCPHCHSFANTPDERCPYCRRRYRRRPVAAMAAIAAVTSAVVLGGVALMLAAFGTTLRSELDSQVTTVQRDFDRNVGRLQRDIQRSLDQRLGPAGAPAAP